MTAPELLSCILNDAAAPQLSTDEWEKLVKDYPWCQPIRALYAKQMQQHPDGEFHTATAAIYSNEHPALAALMERVDAAIVEPTDIQTTEELPTTTSSDVESYSTATEEATEEKIEEKSAEPQAQEETTAITNDGNDLLRELSEIKAKREAVEAMWEEDTEATPTQFAENTDDDETALLNTNVEATEVDESVDITNINALQIEEATEEEVHTNTGEQLEETISTKDKVDEINDAISEAAKEAVEAYEGDETFADSTFTGKVDNETEARPLPNAAELEEAIDREEPINMHELIDSTPYLVEQKLGILDVKDQIPEEFMQSETIANEAEMFFDDWIAHFDSPTKNLETPTGEIKWQPDDLALEFDYEKANQPIDYLKPKELPSGLDANKRINQFLKEQIQKKKTEPAPRKKQKVGTENELLAALLVKQGKPEKAIEIYKKLSLKYPEKSGFFADQIQKIEEER